MFATFLTETERRKQYELTKQSRADQVRALTALCVHVVAKAIMMKFFTVIYVVIVAIIIISYVLGIMGRDRG